MRRFSTALLYVFVATSPAWGQQDPPARATDPPPVPDVDAQRAEELYQEGRKLLFQLKYEQAADRLEQATAANPAKSSYKLLLAKAYRYAEKPDQAIKVLEQILDMNADHVEAAVHLAELISPRKEPDRVIEILEPLLKFKHDYPLYHLLAEANYEKEMLDEARKYYEEAIRLNPQSSQDHYQVGNIYLAQKRFAKAATAYEGAQRLGFSTGVFHFKLGSVYFNLHNYVGRVATAEIVGAKPGEIKNHLYLIDPVPGQTDTFYVSPPKSAIYQLAEARRQGIDIFEIKFLEANVWLGARRFENADRLYTEVAADVQDKDAGLFWFYWAQAALGRGELDLYLERLGKAIELDPDVYEATRSDAFVTVANRYQQRGDSLQYLEYLKKAVETNPLSARLHLTLGDAFWLGSENAKAVEQYKLVLELEPQHAERVRLLNRIGGKG